MQHRTQTPIVTWIMCTDLRCWVAARERFGHFFVSEVCAESISLEGRHLMQLIRRDMRCGDRSFRPRGWVSVWSSDLAKIEAVGSAPFLAKLLANSNVAVTLACIPITRIIGPGGW